MRLLWCKRNNTLGDMRLEEMNQLQSESSNSASSHRPAVLFFMYKHTTSRFTYKTQSDLYFNHDRES